MNNKKKYTLNKEERLYAQKRIDALFQQGESFISYPLRIVYVEREKSDVDPFVSILTSVSKKRFKRAVQRNRVKRLIREAYRLNKDVFINAAKLSGTSFDIAFLYLKNELPNYIEIEKAISKAAALLAEKIGNKKRDNEHNT